MPGPVTKDTSSLALGLAQVRVGASVANIANKAAVLASSDSIGSLANTKFTHEIEYWRHSSGFPLLEDHVIPLRGSAKLECSFEEINPKNIGLALGDDVSTGSFNVHSGAVYLGNLESPAYMRMEAIYTFPDNTYTMQIIFPRAQIEGTIEIDLQKEDAAGIPITFAAKRADSAVTAGNAAWDLAPLGVIHFKDA
jgi:hypothetical protein